MTYNVSTAQRAVAVTPSNTVAIDRETCRALYVGVAGDITCVMDGVTILFSNVPVGILPIQTRLVASTGTTATSIVALF